MELFIKLRSYFQVHIESILLLRQMTEYHNCHTECFNPVYPVDSLHNDVFDYFPAKVAFFSELTKNMGSFFIMMIVRCISLSSIFKNNI